MGFFSRDIKTFNDLFIHALRAIYYAEKKIAKALPDMVDKASDNGLKDGFERHCDQTEVHIERLEKAFEMLGARGQDRWLSGDRWHSGRSGRDFRRHR